MFDLLKLINSPADLRSMDSSRLPDVCQELREFLIDTITSNGGHFSANLGTVELTVALHYTFNTPVDQIIWDVGHQAYGHKVLTGRRKKLKDIRNKGGISGFPKIGESEFDTFGTGHSSTSISAALGFAVADKLSGNSRHHIAVIGDGSLSAGMVWEALNNAAKFDGKLLIIINDNRMGIDPNTGALGHYLDALNADKPNFFTDLGFNYIGPTDGHDIDILVQEATALKDLVKPTVWHIRTVKGKGYAPAEAEQTKWHAVKYVKIRDQNKSSEKRFQDVFGRTLVELAENDDRIVGITPAMPSGCSMNKMMDRFPDRTFDVGIAEQHAVTFAAGLAVNGAIPFCNIYSSFAQRAYDQVIHDVCLQNLPVILCLDRSGVVGEDGATHHGLYDIAFLQSIPNLEILAPSDGDELIKCMRYAANNRNCPVAIRYPKGSAGDSNDSGEQIFTSGYRQLTTGSNGVILAVGPMAQIAAEATIGLDVTVVDMRFIKPLNIVLLNKLASEYNLIITIEDGCLTGGFGSVVAHELLKIGYTGRFDSLGFPDEVIQHASRQELLSDYGLDAGAIRKRVANLIPSI